MLKSNIFITGFMGTGKSTIARALADRIGKVFIDMDTMIEKREGIPIVDIFNVKGEDYFRKLEERLLQEIVGQQNLVVATGGGTLLNERNDQLVLRNGIIILLWARPEVILDRLREERSRPLLLERNKWGKILFLMEKRKKQYGRFSNCIDTSDLTVKQVVDKVIMIHGKNNHENNDNTI